MIECWMDRKIYEKQKDGWMDIKKCMDRKKNGWMDKTNRWMVGRKKKYMKTIDGQLDAQKQQMDGWI